MLNKYKFCRFGWKGTNLLNIHAIGTENEHEPWGVYLGKIFKEDGDKGVFVFSPDTYCYEITQEQMKEIVWKLSELQYPKYEVYFRYVSLTKTVVYCRELTIGYIYRTKNTFKFHMSRNLGIKAQEMLNNISMNDVYIRVAKLQTEYDKTVSKLRKERLELKPTVTSVQETEVETHFKSVCPHCSRKLNLTLEINMEQ